MTLQDAAAIAAMQWARSVRSNKLNFRRVALPQFGQTADRQVAFDNYLEKKYSAKIGDPIPIARLRMGYRHWLPSGRTQRRA